MCGLLVFALLLGSAAATLAYISHRFDLEVLEREHIEVRDAFMKHAAVMANAALKGVTERDALESLARGDYARIHNLLGKPLDDQFGFEFVYITDAAGKLVYSSEFGQRDARKYFKKLTKSLEMLAQKVPPRWRRHCDDLSK